MFIDCNKALLSRSSEAFVLLALSSSEDTMVKNIYLIGNSRDYSAENDIRVWLALHTHDRKLN